MTIEVTVTPPATINVDVVTGGAPAPSGGASGLPWILDSGYWYPVARGVTMQNAPDGPLIDRLCAIALDVPQLCSVDAIGVAIVQALAGALARFGIYADAGGRPGALEYGSPPVDMGASGFVSTTLAPAVTLTAGWHWFAYVAQGTMQPAMHMVGGLIAAATTAYGTAPGLGTHDALALLFPTHYYQLLAPSQPLPDPWGPSLQAGGEGMPALWLRPLP